MTNQAERKSVLGLRDLYISLVTQDDASAYAANTPEYFAPAVNANQAPSVNSETQYADDAPFDVMTAEGETVIEIEVTAIPLSMQALVLGKEFDVSTGRMFDNGGTPPDVALSFRAVKSTGSYMYFQFLKGKFSSPSQESATKTDTPEPKTTKITFTAVKTIYQFDLGSVNDGVKRVVGDGDAVGFDGATWFNAVQVPVVGTPAAFTVTPSPADGAVGQTTTVAINLTFSNPLAGNAEKGIVLVRQSTGAIFATTRTLNAARTVLTLAHAALTSGAVYHIVVPGVTDIYGQALEDVVYDFTVA